MTARLAPTEEDLAIFARSVRRMARWALAASRGEADKGAAARRTVAAMKNMTLDYAEFPREGGSR